MIYHCIICRFVELNWRCHLLCCSNSTRYLQMTKKVFFESQWKAGAAQALCTHLTSTLISVMKTGLSVCLFGLCRWLVESGNSNTVKPPCSITSHKRPPSQNTKIFAVKATSRKWQWPWPLFRVMVCCNFALSWNSCKQQLDA